VKPGSRFLTVLFVLAVSATTVAGALDNANASYSFDSDTVTGSTLVDDAGFYNGTINGATTGVTGLINEAFAFDGTNDYVDTTIPDENTDFTLSIWFKTNQSNNAPFVSGWKESAPKGIIFGVNPRTSGTNNKVGLFLRSDNTKGTLWEGNVSVSDGSWHNAIVSYDQSKSHPNEVEMWVDGQKQNISVPSDDGDQDTWQNTMRIAENNFSGNNLKGSTEQFLKYSRVLNTTEIDNLYNSGNAYDPYQGISIQAKDAFDGSTIKNFSVNLTGQTTGTTYDLNTSSGELVTPVLSNSSELWTVQVKSPGYFNESYEDLNVSENTKLQASLADNRTRFTTAQTKITNTSQTTFNITIQGQTFPSNTTFASPDDYNATYSKAGWYNLTDEYNATQNNTFQGVYNAKANITTAYYEDNETLSHTGWISHPDHAYNETFQSNSDNESIIGVEKLPGPYTAYIEPDNYDSPLPINSFNTTINTSKKQIRKYYYATYRFEIRNEVNGEPFNVSSTDSTTVQIQCPKSSQTQTFNTYNKSFAIDCAWTTVKLNVQYTDDSYFRTVIPSLTTRDIDLYALNLEEVLIYQTNLKLNDLTGRYENGYARVDTYVNGTQEQITSQYFDVENQVTLYLLKDQTYTLCLYTENGEQSRCLGEFIADSAGTKTITVPQLNLVTGDDNAIGEQIVTYWENTNKTITATHKHSTDTTAYFSINQDNQTTYNTSTTGKTTKFTYTKPNTTETYTACITTKADDYADCRVFPPTYGDYLGLGEYLDEPQQTLNLISLAAMIFTLFFVGYLHPPTAVFLVFVELYTFQTWNMITFGSQATDTVILTVIGFIAATTLIVKGVMEGT